MRTKQLIVFAIIVGVPILVISLWWRLALVPDTNAWRDMRAAFATYRVYHNGRMPSDIQELVAFCRQQEGVATETGSRSPWEKFAYVSNLRTNDPPGIPVIIDVPDGIRWQKGVVGLYDGSVLFLPRKELSRLAEEPWLPVQNQFMSQADLDEFKQRVKVILPER